MCPIALLLLTVSLLGSCSQSQLLSIEDNPQEILHRKFNNPQAELTANESIALVDHCAELGEQNATATHGKETCLAMGKTGVGKSTFLNGIMECKLALVKPSELGLKGVKKVVVVDPDVPCPEVIPIGHGKRLKPSYHI